MNRLVLCLFTIAYTVLLTAAVATISTDEDCRTQIHAGPNGTVLFTCPEVDCDDSSACTKDSSIIVILPEIGMVSQHYCRCGDYSPNLPCLGFGFINVETATWTYECLRNGCDAPCKEFEWPPVAAPQTLCDC